MTRLRLLLTFLALALAACIAPDGSTITVATVDEENRVQVQRVEVTAVEEYYRGLWTMCAYVTATDNGGYADVHGCTELVASAYANDEHLNMDLMPYWNWELVQVQETQQ